jgi:hypothetical protein
MGQPRQLLALQQLDSELDQAIARLAEIDRLLNEDEKLRAAQAAADEAAQAHDAAQRELKHAEDAVADQNDKVKRNQQVLYSGTVKNPKELEDLQLESEALARHLATLEERQLESMIAFEEQNTRKQTADGELKQIKNQVATQNSQLNAEHGNLEKRTTELNQKRSGLAGPIEPEGLALYDRIRKTGGGLAVVQVNGNTCPACGDTLTSAQAQEARSQASLTQCAACNRILTA